MRVNKKLQLGLGIVLAVGLICILATAIYIGRDVLVSHGYNVTHEEFMLALFLVLGAGYGLVAKIVLRKFGEKSK